MDERGEVSSMMEIKHFLCSTLYNVENVSSKKHRARPFSQAQKSKIVQSRAMKP